ncbi:MAG: hypothetical protein EZS28_035770 [Streblomastix strix]|uniref:RNase H type-1 domain-containing protein n=1 Tax=Streblomastix strix TaxID=222440 RepID=A0A5J4UFA7_9EUKA|nr:MAG: hypothetical protein EZS28_035770 [Streblomastix strix]
MLDQNPTAMMTTDAAERGCGATLQSINLNLLDAGLWKGKQHLTDSVYNEMAEVPLALRSFQRALINEVVQVLLLQTDNQTVEYLFGRWRATFALLHLVRTIFQVQTKLKIKLKTIHIQGLRNKDADSFSRLAWRGDYRINPSILILTMNTLNFITGIDIIVTRTNKSVKDITHCQRIDTQLEKRDIQHQLIQSKPSDSSTNRINPENFEENEDGTLDCHVSNA